MVFPQSVFYEVFPSPLLTKPVPRDWPLRKVAASTLPSVSRASVPNFVAPMLATSGTLPDNDEGWVYEVKWDGVRAIIALESSGLVVTSRNARDISGRYPELEELIELAGSKSLLLDGEVVAFDEAGKPSFQRLQHRMHAGNVRDVQRHMTTTPVVYVVFDVLWDESGSLLDLPWEARRARLDAAGLEGTHVRTSLAHRGAGGDLLEAARLQGLEGIMAKRVDAAYAPGRRSPSWRKVKNFRGQEVVVGGWTTGEGGRANHLGALVVGYYDERDGELLLRYAGRVGTGFTEKTLNELRSLLQPLARDTSPFSDPVPIKGVHYVDPVLVAEVAFGEWTTGGVMRHPSFKGLRDDKTPTDVRRET